MSSKRVSVAVRVGFLRRTLSNRCTGSRDSSHDTLSNHLTQNSRSMLKVGRTVPPPRSANSSASHSMRSTACTYLPLRVTSFSGERALKNRAFFSSKARERERETEHLCHAPLRDDHAGARDAVVVGALVKVEPRPEELVPCFEKVGNLSKDRGVSISLHRTGSCAAALLSLSLSREKRVRVCGGGCGFA